MSWTRTASARRGRGAGKRRSGGAALPGNPPAARRRARGPRARRAWLLSGVAFVRWFPPFEPRQRAKTALQRRHRAQVRRQRRISRLNRKRHRQHQTLFWRDVVPSRFTPFRFALLGLFLLLGLGSGLGVLLRLVLRSNFVPFRQDLPSAGEFEFRVRPTRQQLHRRVEREGLLCEAKPIAQPLAWLGPPVVSAVARTDPSCRDVEEQQDFVPVADREPALPRGQLGLLADQVRQGVDESS